MALGTFIGGMANAYQGFRRGERNAQDRAKADEDRQFQLEQRDMLRKRQELEQTQLQRQAEEMERADKLRADLGKIPVSQKTVLNPGQMDDEGNAMPAAEVDKPRRHEDIVRDSSLAYQKAGDTGKYLELQKQADMMGYERSSKAFGELQAGAATMPPLEVARAVGQIIDDDPTNAKVQEIKEVPGGVSLTIVNRDSGAAATKTFVGPDAGRQLLASLQPKYDPSGYKTRLDQEYKLEIERAKKSGVTSVPDGYVTTDAQGNRKFTRTRDSEALAAARSSGSGAKGKAPKTSLDAARGVLADIAKNAEDKPTGRQLADGEAHLSRLIEHNPNLPPERAATAAYRASTDPASVRVSLNAKTGSFDRTVVDDDGAQYTLHPGVDVAGLDKNAAKQMVEAMIAQQGDDSYQQDLRAAAHDPKLRQKLLQEARDEVKTEVDKALAQNPQQRDAILDEAEKRLKQDAQALERKLALIRQYTPPPKAGKKDASSDRTQGSDDGPPTFGDFGVRGMRDNMLKRLAGIDGHRAQQAAIEELARRKSAAEQAEPVPALDVPA